MYMTLQLHPSEFPYKENLVFFFISAVTQILARTQYKYIF
jgi:hypothetical protein